MASFTTLTPPDNVVFSATRPCVFTFVQGPGDEILTGGVNVDGKNKSSITAGVITNHSNQYALTAAQPGGSGTDWVYTFAPTNGWPDSPTAVSIFASSPGIANQSRTLTVGGGYVDDHTATALDRMLDQFEGSGDLRALASSYVDQIQALENAATQLLHDRDINTASGAQLDGIGQIVNVTRGGLDDDPEYRLRLKGELAILFSQGSINEMLAIVQLLIPTLADGDIQARDLYPKTLYIRPIDHILTEDPQTIAMLLRRAVAAATELLFVYGLSEDDELFTLSSQGATLETSSALGFANTAQTTGGKLAGSA